MSASSASAPPQSEPLRLVLWGASGRMGGATIRAIAANPGFVLSAAVCSDSSDALGTDAAEHAGVHRLGVSFTTRPEEATPWDVLLDFSLPEGSLQAAQFAAQAGRPAVIGATGFNPAQMRQFRSVAEQIPLLVAPNFSLLVGALAQLLQTVRAVAGEDAQIELAETHHRQKRDLPSGTARALAERSGLDAAQVRSDYAAEGRDIVCTYTIKVTSPGEKQTIHYESDDRQCFVLGALKACQWLVGQPAGFYGMDDLLRGQFGAGAHISAANP